MAYDGEDENYETIQDAAVDVGHIEECDDHSGSFVLIGDDETKGALFERVVGMWKRGKLKGTREQVQETTEKVINDAGFDCEACERLAAE